MNLDYIKCSKFTSNNDINIKRKIEEKTNLYPNYIICGFKMIETTDKQEINDLFKNLNYIYRIILLYCLNFRTKTESETPRVTNSNRKRIKLLSKQVGNNSIKSRFIKEQEARRLLNSLGLKYP